MALLAWLQLRRDRQSQIGLAITVGAIALAVLLLLVVAHFPQAMGDRGQRLGWRSGYALEAVPPGDADAWWAMPVSGDHFQGMPIGRLDVATIDLEAPPPSGLPRQPRPGEVWLSPALHDLVRTVPSDQLGDRFAGEIAGEISSEGLTDASELVVVVGRTVDEARQLGAVPVAAPYPTAQRVAGRLTPVATVLAGVAVVAPLVMLIASATRLQAASRNQRLGALRLLGATPHQVTWLTIWLAAGAATVGSVLGLVAFLALRTFVATSGFVGVRFFATDFSLHPLGWLVVLLAPVAAVAGTLLGLRRLNVSPLGVARRAFADRLQRKRLWLLMGSVLLFALTLGIVFSGALSEGLALTAIAGSFAVVVVGVVVAGPWVTAAIGRLVTRLAGRPEAMLAGRRISHDATGNYRLATGIVLVALAGGLFYALTPALEAEAARGQGAGLRPNVLMALMPAAEGDYAPRLEGVLQKSPWVERVATAGETLGLLEDGSGLVAEIGSCAELAVLLELGGVQCGDARIAVADDITIPTDPLRLTVFTQTGAIETTLSPIPSNAPRFHVDRIQRFNDLIVDPQALQLPDGERIRIQNLYVGYNGDPTTAERIRTLIVSEVPTAQVYTAAEARQAALAPLRQARGPVAAALIVTLIIGGVAAAISAAGSLLERRNQLTQMRIIGLPLETLRRVFAVEALAPLAIITVGAALVGIGVAGLLLVIGEYHTPALVQPTGALVLATGLAVALALAATPILLLDRTTRYESIRTE